MADRHGDDDPLAVEDEYAVQYFGFLPQSLLNGMYNGIWEYLKDAMSALNESILVTFKDMVSEAELHEVSHKQGQVAVDRLNERFDRAENYLFKNVFSIPQHIVLPEDRQHLENPCTEEEMAELDNEIKDVLDRILAVKYANAQLQDRLLEIDCVQQQLDTTLNSVDSMHTNMTTQSLELVRTVNSCKHVASLVENCRLDTALTCVIPDQQCLNQDVHT